MAKDAREKFKVWGNVFDEYTLYNLFKMEGKYFEALESPLAIGKEANVFTAKTKEGRIIVKIYRLETCDFNKMYDYIKADPRYENLKKKKRQIVFAWAQREFRNLMKAREIGVRVPVPINCTDNILTLEFIGDDVAGNAAPKVKDLKPKDPSKFYKKVADAMKKMYRNEMVHGDLSEFNILNNNETPVLIDFSQATTANNPNAEELLVRDIRNICRFFKKLKVNCDEETLTKEIKDYGKENNKHDKKENKNRKRMNREKEKKK